METVKITRIAKFDKNKQGQPLVTKNGKPYTRLLINTDKYGEQPLSGFANSETDSWKEGDSVEVKVEKVNVNGREFLNFSTPRKEDKLQGEITSVRKEQMLQRNTIAKLVEIIQKEGLDKKHKEEIINPMTKEPHPTPESEPTMTPDRPAGTTENDSGINEEESLQQSAEQEFNNF